MKKTTSKRITIAVAIIVVVLLTATVGGSFYMLSYSLSPEPNRSDTAVCFQRLTNDYPEVKPWLDSVRTTQVMRDTFVQMPRGERHHAYLVSQPEAGAGTAIVVHGWRNCAIDFMYIARLYHLLGFNVLLPDLHAHGLSEGDAIGMGWQERHDVIYWMEVAAKAFGSDRFVVHGVSMGAATTMNVSGEAMPDCVQSVRFVEDCGYTSVWDEFSYKLFSEFGLPEFPLMYSTSLLCRLRYDWSFGQAAPIRQVAKCPYPMLFIHGDNDHFVPSPMVYPLYEAKTGEKERWITKGTAHALSYHDYKDEYTRKIQEFTAGQQ